MIYKNYYILYINMLIPIRCFTCGNVIANRYPKYKEELQKHLKDYDGKPVALDVHRTFEGELLDKLNINKYCCRRHFLAQIDMSRYVTL